MAFRDGDEVFPGASIELPIKGKFYKIRYPDAETGKLVARLWADANDPNSRVVLDDGEEKDLYQRILGATWGELVADRVPLDQVGHVGLTAMVWIAVGEAAAEAYWNRETRSEDGLGEAEARTPPGSPHESSEAATTTRTPASGSTTKASTPSRKGSRGRGSTRRGT